MGGSELFLNLISGILVNREGLEIFLKSNGNLIVYCSSDKHKKVHSIGETTTIT